MCSERFPVPPELAGPCGRTRGYIEVSANDDPVEVVARLSRSLMGTPLLVHSTSWQRAPSSVILSFVVVNRDDQAPELTGNPIVRAPLARGSATGAPSSIEYAQVLEHGCDIWRGSLLTTRSCEQR